VNDDFLTDSTRGCAPGKANADLFFSENQAELNEAKRVCMACPVRAACDEYATATGQAWGVWAGVNRSRNAAKVRRHKAMKRAVAA
jgi:WhiB family redox-sensing transcriptional regulator